MVSRPSQAWCYHDTHNSMTETYSYLKDAREACSKNPHCTMMIMNGGYKDERDDYEDIRSDYGIALCKGIPTTSSYMDFESISWMKSKFCN